MSTASFKAAQIIKCINAGVSCLASTFIMLMILTEPEKGLASPYSRIIFAMSISDILFSLGQLLSPFMGPKDNSDALFAIGTTGSCEAIGFIFIIGFCCLVWYTVFLTYYFTRRIKYKVTPQNFAKKEEKYFHAIFIVLAMTLGMTSVATKSINPQGKGNICGIGSYPNGCEDQFPDITCERGNGKVIGILLTMFGSVLFASFFIIILILAMFTHHVYREERTLTIPAREIGRTVDQREQHSDEDAEDAAEVEQQAEEENVDEVEESEAVRANRKEKNRLVLTKQAFHQSLLYILAFFLVYLPPLTGLFLRRFANEKGTLMWRFWLSALFTPLTGVFNILIYTRPKVLKLKETLPNAAMYELLIVIVFSGGEIPSMADILQATTTRRHHHGEEVQGEEVHEGQFEDDRGDDLSEEASSAVSSNSLISYDLDVSSEVELLSRMKESGQSLISVMRQRR
ncbi:hypothetical protein CTEN210_01085 [Chaetoceros tenuissimus]|uniref:G-protein coupled receptors family 1 profile domain-containing protein n=1 Tax=Chaetoceros tenuissimus TaxID=426638 RepID=A0AAD3GZD8_9STRA|nr:hypothetical protein CTEN210_01085 [Chaetoceros tenuissimus]